MRGGEFSLSLDSFLHEFIANKINNTKLTVLSMTQTTNRNILFSPYKINNDTNPFIEKRKSYHKNPIQSTTTVLYLHIYFHIFQPPFEKQTITKGKLEKKLLNNYKHKLKYEIQIRHHAIARSA